MERRLISPNEENLIMDNMGLVIFVANQYKKQYIEQYRNKNYSDYEDLDSTAKFGLVKAALTFDESKDTKFSTYATTVMKNEIKMLFRKERLHSGNLYLNSCISKDNDNQEININPQDQMRSKVDVENEYLTKESAIRVINIILNLLKYADRQIMLYLVAGYDYKSIAQEINCSNTSASTRIKNLKDKVRVLFNSKKKIEEVFSMTIVGEFYKISFNPKDMKQFNNSFIQFLPKLDKMNNLSDFKVESKEGKVTLTVPADPESFEIIAKIIKEMEEYEIEFLTKKEKSNEKPDFSKKKNEDEKKLLEYFLRKDSFTTQELKAKFPEIKKATRDSVIRYAKGNHWIENENRGAYKVYSKLD